MVVLDRDGSVMRNAAVILERNGAVRQRKPRQFRWFGRFFLSVRWAGNYGR